MCVMLFVAALYDRLSCHCCALVRVVPHSFFFAILLSLLPDDFPTHETDTSFVRVGRFYDIIFPRAMEVDRGYVVVANGRPTPLRPSAPPPRAEPRLILRVG